MKKSNRKIDLIIAVILVLIITAATLRTTSLFSIFSVYAALSGSRRALTETRITGWFPAHQHHSFPNRFRIRGFIPPASRMSIACSPSCSQG